VLCTCAKASGDFAISDRLAGFDRSADRVNNLAPQAARLHPTQKPIPVMRRLIEDFSKPGELVLDCFAARAARLLQPGNLAAISLGATGSSSMLRLRGNGWRAL